MTAGDVTTDVFKELDRRSLARHAADHLKGLIASGSLVPGDRLPPERELARRLGVSRPTLREAAGALVIMGLLESRQGAGTFVAQAVGEATAADAPVAVRIAIDVDGDPLGALFELRLLLEPIATERAAGQISDRELAQLRKLLEEMVRRQRDPEPFIRIDSEFHRQIQLTARSTLILAMLDRISALALRKRTLSARKAGATQRSVAEHLVILEALEAHDATLAKAAMTAHLVQIRRLLIGQAT